MKTPKQDIEKILENLSSKQRNLILEVVQDLAEKGGRTKKEMLKNAGYSKVVQETPAKAFKSKKMSEALEKIGIENDFMAIRQKSHLEARKIEQKDTDYTWEEYQEDPVGVKEEIQEELDEDMPGARIIRVIRRTTRTGYEYVTVKFSYPDYVAQDRALDKVYKLTGAYAPEKKEHSIGEGLASLFSDE